VKTSSSSILISSPSTIGLTAAIAVILLAANFTITNAQQLTGQPGEIENRTATTTTIFQSTEDSFRVQVPEGWIIHDVNNTGSTLLEEATQGYGILAQLCPQEEQQQPALSNVSGDGDSAICQGSEEDVIHIIRYPDLDTRLQVSNNVTTNNNITIDNILLYHLQKLKEVGYRDIQFVNSTETTVNLAIAQTNETIERVPGRLVEMTYSTNFAPNETRRGYFILTASDATAPNLGTIKGYTILYEGSPVAAEEETTTASDSLLSPIPVRQVFDSFELIAASELAQAIAQEAQAAETTEDGGGDGGDSDEDNGDHGGDEGDRDEGDGGEDNDGGDDDGNREEGPTMAERIIEEGEEMVERIIEETGVELT
jgi:hypothetical protein